MFYRTTLSDLFGPAHLFVDLVIQLWIAFILIYVLILKDCLDIFLWMFQKLKRIVIWILQILCVYNTLVWISFLKEVQKNFPHQIFPWFSDKQQGSEGIESIIRAHMHQEQSNEFQAKNKDIKQYKCQSCQVMSDILWQCKNFNEATYPPLHEVLKHNVSTQTEFKRKRSDLNSPESLNNRLKSNNIKKQITSTCNFSSPKCSTFFKLKNDLISRSLNPEFAEIDDSSMVGKKPRRKTTEESGNIPLESAANFSHLLESKIDIETVRNLGLQLSQDICIRNSVGTQTVSECEHLRPEFEKIVSSPTNQNVSRTDIEECTNIILESTANFPQQLESSICQNNFKSVRNSGSLKSQDFLPVKNVGTQTVTDHVFDENPNYSSFNSANVSQRLENPLCQNNLESIRNSGALKSQDFCVESIRNSGSPKSQDFWVESIRNSGSPKSQDFCVELIRNSGSPKSQDFWIGKNVGTRAVSERESLDTENSYVQNPIHISLNSVFAKELDSEQSSNNLLKSSNIKKIIALKSNLSSPRCSTFQCKNDSSSRSLVQEFEKSYSPPVNQNDSRRLITDEYVDIPLESPPNVSQLLESPLCQLNFESMRNLRLQFSQDSICFPKMSPEEKSFFKNGWNKLKLIQNVNKRFLELKNTKRRQNEETTISKQCVGGEASTNIPYQKKTKNLNEEDSNMFGCCGSMFQRLKSKFIQTADNASVTYKKF